MRIHAAVLVLLIAACDRGNTPAGPVAGSEKEPKTAVLEAGAAVLQNKAPMDAINVYLDGFHFASGDMKQQMEAHHYCAKLNEDLTQCVLYDGNQKEARLIGIEYVISGALFAKLPAEEKKLWHSHVHEVKSGQLIAPGIPEIAEHELMEQLVSTYGKTWHTWEGGPIPSGIPRLMMGFTAEGQLAPALLAARDQRFNESTSSNRANRDDIVAPPIDPGADAWQGGEVVRLGIAE